VYSWRQPDAFTNPQFFAEEGSVFFADVYHYGLQSMGMVYAGNLHLVPRACAWLAWQLFPLQWQPAAYTMMALALLLAVSAYACFKLRPLAGDFGAAAMALCITTVPVATEVFYGLTNIQWILCLALVVLLGTRQPGQPRTGWAGLLLAALCGLTGPFSLLLLPGVLAVTWLDARGGQPARYDTRLLLVIAGTALVQALLIVAFPYQRVDASDGSSAFWPSVRRAVFLLAVHTTHIEALVGDSSSTSPLKYPVYMAMAIVAGLLLHAGYRQWKSSRNVLIPFALFAACMVLFATFFAFRRHVGILHPLYAGARYFYVPTILLAWVCLYACNLRSIRVKPALVASGVLLLVFHSIFYPPAPLYDMQWKRQAQMLEKNNGPDTIPINPAGWTIYLGNQKRFK
jgi:hypothetical protein